jgi:hypothetical protein
VENVTTAEAATPNGTPSWIVSVRALNGLVPRDGTRFERQAST